MKIAALAEVKARFSEYVKATEEGPVVVTRNGRPAAVLLAAGDDDELERLLLSYSPRFREVLRRSREEIRTTGGMEHEELWREVESEGARAQRQPALPHHIHQRRQAPQHAAESAEEHQHPPELAP